ncbi:hypothetical protein CDD81_247 [Ophiocordyceps australis]|uniref:Peptidase S8/S53 domain-containing protein n=1 Tax=Ophiocordyceps australis TaxID=1399860 RepID=A0A2C5YGR9_9HYPO|nr:hypothetical protein CDD81_247 [Ophiocordyceps australis]
MVRPSLLLALPASILASPARHAPSAEVVPGAYIVEVVQGQDASAVYGKVQRQGRTRMRFDYELFQGLSVQIDNVDEAHKQAAELAALPAVKNVWPVRLYDMPNPTVQWVGSGGRDGKLVARDGGGGNASADGFSPHVMTQVDRLRAKGITGKGVKIAVIDTGIDYLHPALGGCFGPGCLVSFGTDLVGDAYNGSNTPTPDPNPMDCAGHGTHVAGIVAAQPSANKYSFTGAAPDAILGAYRVFGCKGQVSNDVLIAAYNQAYQDGADIITASIGGPSGWSEDPWAVAVSRIVQKGVPCTVSAGNEGAEGMFYASGAADGKFVTAIASFDNSQTPMLLSEVSYRIDNGSDVRFGYAPGEPSAWNGVTLPLYATSLDPSIKDDACSPLPASTPDLSRKIVLIRRGSCNFVVKAANAAAKGAKYIMVYNNVPAGASAIDLGDVPGILAGGMTMASLGATWIAALRANRTVTLAMASADKAGTALIQIANNETGGALSEYTTWGPTWEMDLKPQVGTPGGNILSTWPRALGSYAVLSGTSMACPLAAGIVALVSQVRGTLDPYLIESLLSATSKPQLFNDGHKFADYLAPAAQQGGGMVQAYDAAYATTLLQPSGLSFNDSDHFVSLRNFTLSNKSARQITYNLSHVPAITAYTLSRTSIYPEPFPNSVVHDAATIKLSQSSLSLAPGASASINVEPTPPRGLDAQRLALWSGWIAINGSDGSALSIPYQGLTGSLNKAQVLKSDDTWIAMSNDKMLLPVGSNVSFTLPPPGTSQPWMDLPALVVQLALGSPQVRADVVPLGPTKVPVPVNEWGVKSIGQPFGFAARWNTRGPNPFAWDGRLDSGNYAPPGPYKLVVRALHIFADEADKTQWDVSETPSLVIRYE